MTSIAPLHEQEQERLHELYRLGVLDTDSEKRFDRITKLVSETLGFPTVLISLIDENRQWFKSKCNFEVDETSREVAFCAHAINQEDGILMIPDASADERFADNPLVTSSPFIKSYIGVVLRSPKRLPLGTLCAIDTSPRTFSDKDISTLRMFSELAEAELLRNVSGGAWENPLSDSTALGMESLDFIRAVEGVMCSNPSSELAFLIIDIPKLRAVRRTFGSVIGEEVLNEVARRCRLACINRRYLFGKSDHHLFQVLIEIDPAQDSLETLSKDIEQAIGDQVQTSAVTVFTPVHIGVSSGPSNMGNYSNIIREAEIALNTLRGHQSGGHVSIYREHMEEEVSRNNFIISRFQGALDQDVINLFFQPKVRLSDNRIIGAEALIRWTDDTVGYISPMELLDVVDKTGQNERFDYWVADRVCKFLIQWQSQGLFVLPVSINVSGKTFNKAGFIKQVSKIISAHNLDPKLIDIEILESTVLDDTDAAIDKIQRGQRLGLTFSLDDFGTGQSSLAYLRTLPVNTLKIDKSFIDDIVQDTTRSALVRQIIDIGHTLKMKVVVEGVEDSGQHIILRALGCDSIQGYYFAKPMPADDFLQLATSCNNILSPAGSERL